MSPEEEKHLNEVAERLGRFPCRLIPLSPAMMDLIKSYDRTVAVGLAPRRFAINEASADESDK